MKTLIRNTSLVLMSLFPLLAFAAGDIISKNVSVQNFDQIVVGNAARLTIVQGETPTLTVTTTEELMKQVTIKQSGDTLYLGINNKGWDLRGIKNWFNWGWNKNHGKVLFEVQLPDLKKLSVSGASKVLVNDMQFRDLQLKISGASKLAADKIRLDNLNADISGASKLNINEVNAENVEMELSGASGAEISTLQVKELKLSASGASGLSVLDGAAENLIVNASGASKFDGTELVSDHVKSRASGASKIRVHAKVSLESKSSGASSIKNSGKTQLN